MGKAGGGYTNPWVHQPSASWQHSGIPDQSDDHPAVCINWHEARAFCEWLSRTEGLRYRLPSDEEWSAAAGSTRYPWGDSFPPPQRAGNYWDRTAIRDLPGHWEESVFGGHPYDDSSERTAPVGLYPANHHGFFDMGGNVWEWCEDVYRPDLNAPDILEANATLRESFSPTGMPYRVLRGASWDNFAESTLRTSYRDFDEPERRDDDYGFRIALEFDQAGLGVPIE